MREFNYSKIYDNKWDSELLGLVAAIYKEAGKQEEKVSHRDPHGKGTTEKQGVGISCSRFAVCGPAVSFSCVSHRLRPGM